MNIKKFRQIRVVITLFVATLVSISITQDSYLLALIAIVTGILFMILAKSKTKVVLDEREKLVREKAAQLTYAIFAPTIGLGGFLLLMIAYGDSLPVFAKADFSYLESLGMVLAYLTLFLILLYSISFYYLNKRYGGNTHEE